MTAIDQLRTKVILETLCSLPQGLSAEAIASQVELSTGRFWADADRALLLTSLRERGLVSSYTSPVTDTVFYVPTGLARVALQGGLR